MGKVKHIDIKMLWIQQEIKKGTFVCKKEKSGDNISDLCTK